MKISVVKENLLHAVSAIGPIVPTKSITPVLYNILLEAEEGKEGGLKMGATDLDISLSYRIKARKKKRGHYHTSPKTGRDCSRASERACLDRTDR